MGIDFTRFDRVITRSGELATKEDVDPIVKRAYEEKLAPYATAFVAANVGLKNAEVVAKKERGEALTALEEIDQPYRKARVATSLYVDDLALPKTLKSLSTDTDKVGAVRSLLEILDSHDDEPGWAADVMAGDFGRLAPIAIREVSEWIDADGKLEKAVHDRQDAYSRAYDRFLRFRDLVRETYTPSSMHYRRLLVRSNGKLAVDDPVDAKDGSDTNE